MIYPLDIEQRLGFNRIKANAERLCQTEGAKQLFKELKLSTNRKRIVADIALVSEFKQILEMEGWSVEGRFVDIEKILLRARMDGAHISAQELAILRSGIDCVCSIVRLFKGANSQKYPYITLLVSKVDTFAHIVEQIDKIIDNTANVRDSASQELSDIRFQKFSKEREASRRVESIMRKAISDGVVEEGSSISIRNGRAVVPVISSHKRKIKGLIQDESATGKTFFIEPEELVTINNEIRELEYQQRREIIRILTIFTEGIKEDIPMLLTNAQFIYVVDFIIAKAKVAIAMDAHKPIINRTIGVELKQARHPILESSLKSEGKSIVPLNLKLTPEKHIIVISGPNAGGKSVCLKCTGLLQYMLQCGFLIPASPNSEMSIFQNIFIDIGDQQSIDNDLSTYSSHLENMKRMLRSSNSDSLVLIDEFGSGTEPTVGGAIAEVILSSLEQRGVFGVITTHYTNLKYYASNATGVTNGAMSFDVNNITPLYSLEQGVPGSSFAFEIAQKIGLPTDIIQQAKGKLDSSQISLERQLRDIARDRVYWERKREEVRRNEKKYQQLSQEYQEEFDKLKKRSAEIVAKAREEAKGVVASANKAVENTIREIKEAQAEKLRTREVRQELVEFSERLNQGASSEEIEKINRKIEKLRQRDADKLSGKRKQQQQQKQTPIEQPKQQQIFVEDKVRIKGQSVIGTVVSIDKRRAQVAFGSITTSVSIATLEHASNNDFRKQQKESSSINYYSGGIVTDNSYDVSDKRLNFKSEIDMRGMRVEEATQLTEKFVDEAYMLGYKELKILHGKGTGALKEEIRKFLKMNPYVVSARDEHVDFGGAGITVITLR